MRIQYRDIATATEATPEEATEVQFWEDDDYPTLVVTKQHHGSWRVYNYPAWVDPHPMVLTGDFATPQDAWDAWVKYLGEDNA